VSKRPGDTDLLPGAIMDRFEFLGANQKLGRCMKIVGKGDSDFAEGRSSPQGDDLNRANAQNRGPRWPTRPTAPDPSRHRQ